MASFALLDDTNTVIQIVVVDDAEVPSDMHPDGELYCKKLFKTGPWKQYSPDGSFRKQRAGRGHVYDEAKDIFIAPNDHPSWTLDENNDWQPPVAFPTVGNFEHPTLVYEEGDFKPDNKEIGDPVVMPYDFIWDEENTRWTAKDKSVPPDNYVWDPSALIWNKV